MFRETVATIAPTARIAALARQGVMTIKDLGGTTFRTVTAELFPKSSVARAFSHQLADTLWLRAQEHVRSDTRPTTTLRAITADIIT